MQLTAIANGGKRRLDLTDWSIQDYETLSPQQWGGEKPFDNRKFQTPNGKARFVPTQYITIEKTGLTLNTGRIRDRWHTMTRKGLVPKLFGHHAEPHVEISSQDAIRLSIVPASIVEVSSTNGTSLARALLSDAMPPGQIFQSMHWSSSYAINALANSASSLTVDPVSGQPALKSSQVSLRPYQATWYGFGVSLENATCKLDYFATHPLNRGFAFECADKSLPTSWLVFIQKLFPRIILSSCVFCT